MADILIGRIRAGELTPDAQLPSQHELVQEFEIAPNTAQKVLRRLREAGWAYSVKGVGTFVAARESWPPAE